MIPFMKKPFWWAKLFTAMLTIAFSFVLLDSFVIPKTYAVVEDAPQSIVFSEPQIENTTNEEIQTSEENPVNETVVVNEEIIEADTNVTTESVITANSYKDENIEITIETVVEYNTTFYVADIQVSDPTYLKTAFANNTYGRNIKATTSEMATDNNAILAINGDYYGFRDTGYVLRNGVLYRETANGEALVIDNNGNFIIQDQSTITNDSLTNIWQILSFGPALVENSTIVVDASTEVSKSKDSNPRTAIGQISTGHYIVIVSDGRTNESEGLSLLQLATEFAERGAEIAYNLDGGGSSSMVFNGQLINTPTSGRSSSEREVSDIVYFGY